MLVVARVFPDPLLTINIWERTWKHIYSHSLDWTLRSVSASEMFTLSRSRNRHLLTDSRLERVGFIRSRPQATCSLWLSRMGRLLSAQRFSSAVDVFFLSRLVSTLKLTMPWSYSSGCNQIVLFPVSSMIPLESCLVDSVCRPTGQPVRRE